MPDVLTMCAHAVLFEDETAYVSQHHDRFSGQTIPPEDLEVANSFTAVCRRVLARAGCPEMMMNYSEAALHGERPTITYAGEASLCSLH